MVDGVVVPWTFTNIHEVGPAPYTYIFHINPNEGGTPTITKNFALNSNAGPNRGAIVQEGQSSVPEMTFGGVILKQDHLQALERWFDKRMLLQIEDDLGRKMRGIFSTWTPQRVRKPYNPWYHTFQATFTVVGYKNADGTVRFGKWV